MLVLVSNSLTHCGRGERTSVIYKYPLSKNQKFLRLKLLPHKQPLDLEDKLCPWRFNQGPNICDCFKVVWLYGEHT